MPESLCAASFASVTFATNTDGNVHLRGYDERDVIVWVPPASGVCPLCKRQVVIRGDGKGFSRHVWQVADGQMKKASYDSAANRAARAFQERGRK